MNCDQKQEEFRNAMAKVQRDLELELAEIAAKAERDAKEISDEFAQGNDLSQGVGAAAGATVGGVVGGVPGVLVGGAIGKVVGSLFTLDIAYEEHVIALDIPQLTANEKEFSFKFPQVTMKTDDIVFNLPQPTMVRVQGPPVPRVVIGSRLQCVGVRPFRVCTNIPTSTIVWDPTWIEVPGIENREVRISMGIPQVVMKEQKIIISLPEVSMKRQEIIYKFPVITLRFIKDAGKRTAAAAEAIANEAARDSAEKKLLMKDRIKVQVVGPALAMFQCYKDEIAIQKSSQVNNFDIEVMKLTDAIKNLKTQGVPETDDDFITQKNQLDTVLAQRSIVVQRYDSALQNLIAKEKEAIDKLLDFED